MSMVTMTLNLLFRLPVQPVAESKLCVFDSQVYTVGPDYAHAEARKSPALDGKVERDSEGKEVRYPVILNAREKLIAWKVCLAFKVSLVTAAHQPGPRMACQDAMNRAYHLKSPSD